MKVIKILCLTAMLSFATGCKKDASTETTQDTEQQEQGGMTDTTNDEPVTPATPDTIAVDSMTTAK
jgi:hypothetical protein